SPTPAIFLLSLTRRSSDLDRGAVEVRRAESVGCADVREVEILDGDRSDIGAVLEIGLDAGSVRARRAEHGTSAVLADIVHHDVRSEEHTSELQSRENLVCR